MTENPKLRILLGQIDTYRDGQSMTIPKKKMVEVRKYIQMLEKENLEFRKKLKGEIMNKEIIEKVNKILEFAYCGIMHNYPSPSESRKKYVNMLEEVEKHINAKKS